MRSVISQRECWAELRGEAFLEGQGEVEAECRSSISAAPEEWGAAIGPGGKHYV